MWVGEWGLPKRVFSVVMFVLLLTSMLTLVFNIQPVKASGTVYIRADGSVDPPDARISSVDNVTYTFTDNINDSVVIERDDIVVDGAGYTVQGTGLETGIYVDGRGGVTIRNTTISNFERGIWLYSSSNNSIADNHITANDWLGIDLYDSSDNVVYGNNMANNDFGIRLFEYSSNNTVYGNNITANHWAGIALYYSSNSTVYGNNITANSEYGIHLYDSSNNSISGNNITNNQAGIFLEEGSSYNTISGNVFLNDGLFAYGSYDNVVVDNSVNGKLLVYLENISDRIVDDAGQVILINCSNIIVENLDLSRAHVGVELWVTKNTRIAKNNITANNWAGIYLGVSSNNTVCGNNITANNWAGIYLGDSFSNTVSGNKITATESFGIWLSSSSNNSINGNSITANNYYGIYLYRSSNNTVYENNITLNYWYGIYLDGSSDNKFCHNNFINNGFQVYSQDSANLWDDGYPSGGNYWSDYSGADFYKGPYQNEAGNDGIGDTPYVIDENNTDRYSLMLPYSLLIGDINQDRTIDVSDAIMAALAFGSYPGHPKWNEQADLNKDGIVDIFDVIILANNFGKS